MLRGDPPGQIVVSQLSDGLSEIFAKYFSLSSSLVRGTASEPFRLSSGSRGLDGKRLRFRLTHQPISPLHRAGDETSSCNSWRGRAATRRSLCLALPWIPPSGRCEQREWGGSAGICDPQVADPSSSFALRTGCSSRECVQAQHPRSRRGWSRCRCAGAGQLDSEDKYLGKEHRSGRRHDHAAAHPAA